MATTARIRLLGKDETKPAFDSLKGNLSGTQNAARFWGRTIATVFSGARRVSASAIRSLAIASWRARQIILSVGAKGRWVWANALAAAPVALCAFLLATGATRAAEAPNVLILSRHFNTI